MVKFIGDFLLTTTTIVFDCQISQNIIEVFIFDDTLDEGDEAFQIVLSLPSNAPPNTTIQNPLVQNITIRNCK